MGLRVVYARHMDEEWSPALAWLLDRVSETRRAPSRRRPAVPGRPGPMWRWPMAVPGLAPGTQRRRCARRRNRLVLPAGHARKGAGLLAVGHQRDERLPREVADLAADLACRVGLALDNARLVGQRR